MPSSWVEKAVEGASRDQRGREELGSVRPNIWRVSSREGKEIWNVGGSGVEVSEVMEL